MNTVMAASPLWYLARASGTVSLVLLTASVLGGILTWSRWGSPAWPRILTTGFHRNVSLLAIGFVTLHVLTNVLDGYAPIRFLDAVLPFGSAYRPLWLGFGAVAFDLLLLVIVTSLLRRRLGWRRWRVIHWAAYACWPIALVHAFGTGSDPRHSWFTAVAVVCTTAVLSATAARIVRARSGSRGLRVAFAASGFVVTAVIATWATIGPLETGWAAQAGTPSALLARSSAATLPAVPFTLPLEGTVAGDKVSGSAVTLDIDGNVGSGEAKMRILITGETSGQDIVPSQIDVNYGSSRDPSEFTGLGQVVSSGVILAKVDDGSKTLDLTIELQLDLSSGTASGTVAGRTAV